jgi:hypothetical protein
MQELLQLLSATTSPLSPFLMSHLCQPMLLAGLPISDHAKTAAVAVALTAPIISHLCQAPDEAHEVHLVVDELHGLVSVLHAQLKVLLGLKFTA